jgi:hypothetical protein
MCAGQRLVWQREICLQSFPSSPGGLVAIAVRVLGFSAPLAAELHVFPITSPLAAPFKGQSTSSTCLW